MNRRFALFILIAFGFVVNAHAQNADKKDMQHFMDDRFGMFIHFGPVTLRGTEIGWSRGNPVPFDDYDNLYKEFNPVLFNADEWVSAARNAGMKYLTITAKHHDGFCLWPTAYSDYNIAHSPFKRDIVKELATACKKQGIDFCIYFTVLDWHDNDYPLHHNGPNTQGDMRAFVNRMKNELGELIDNYHPKMLWFDGFWEEPWTSKFGREVYDYIKKKNPHILVNNRLGKNANTLAGTDGDKLSSESVGDFLTPEQRVGQLNMNSPWESCITMCTQWAWKPNDKMKSLKECIQTLTRTSGGNGNLLFNVGPMMDGRIEARQVNRLREMGDWLKKYGSSIYKTNGGPYAPNDLYSSTRIGNKIYIHVYSANNLLMLPPFPDNTKIEKCYFLGGEALRFDQNPSSPVTIKIVAALLLFYACGPHEKNISRYGMITGLKDDKVAEYKELHAHAWPGVLKKIQECHIQNYTIFLKRIDGHYFLFSYFEYNGSDFKADMDKMAQDSITRLWWKRTDPTQVPLPDAAAQKKIWSSMDEIFHTN